MDSMEPLRGNGKQERETLEVMGIQRKVSDVGRSHLAWTRINARCPPRPACVSSDHDYHITPFSQHSACDGSLSDMLLPFEYDNTLDGLLLEQEELLMQQLLTPRAHINEQSQFNSTSNEDLIHIHDGIIVNDQQLIASAILKSNHDHAQSMIVLPPPLPPLAPVPPARTRRPPLRKGTPSYRENHIHSERQRRQDMTSLFNRLRSLLPNMELDDLKGDRCTILGHVIEYVQELDKKVQDLGKVKATLMQGKEESKRRVEETLASVASVSVRFWGQVDIFITLNCPKQHGLWPNLLAFLQESLQLDVQNVTLSSTPLFCIHSIYAKVMGDDNEEVCCKLQKALRDFVAAAHA